MIARSPFTYAGLAAAALAAVVVAAAQPSRAEPDFAAAFKASDRNGDGRLSREEFGGSNAGAASKAPAKSGEGAGVVLSLNFAETDTNQDASVSLAEFTAFSRAAIQKRFLALDANSDGRITLAELERQGALLGPDPGAKDRPSAVAISAPVQRLFARADKNHDGSVTPEEFGVQP